MKKCQVIKELVITDLNDETGVQAVSFVDMPAIEENFLYFKDLNMRVVDGVDLDQFWKYTAEPEPELIETSHEFCKRKAGGVFHISEIRAWGQLDPKEWAFVEESDFFSSFRGVANPSFNCDQQIYNCRHWLKRVRSLDEIPEYKRQMFRGHQLRSEFKEQIMFEISSAEKREVVGPVLIPNKMIYRNDLGDGTDGYVYFSKETIRKIKEKFGFNRTITIQHEKNITGSAILLDSWIYEEGTNNYSFEVPAGTWFMKYKIIGDELWQRIKNKEVMGYSIEAILGFKN